MAQEFPPIGQFKSGMGNDGSDYLANHRFQFIEFQHIPTNNIVRFKAYITQFSDNYVSDWNDETGYGRMDSVHTFKNTKRNINLGWQLVASSQKEAIDNFERLSLLIQFLYPTYNNDDSGAGTILKSPLMRLKFMNLIKRADNNQGLLGKVSGFANTPNLDMGFFDPLDEINNTANIYPKVIELSTEFSVLHEHQLGFNVNGSHRKGFNNFPYGNNKIPFETKTKKKIDQKTSADDRRGQVAAQKITSPIINRPSSLPFNENFGPNNPELKNF